MQKQGPWPDLTLISWFSEYLLIIKQETALLASDNAFAGKQILKLLENVGNLLNSGCRLFSVKKIQQ
ncbi:hypothetical protein Y1Q_0019276 [Alligator mississippiensis]|uniref:Uncharacterized protein n=1 Tax=Alligator mississippiensis TaxID=8496 RepID=A0A151MQP9_ALLMI|nr:hypothetical protein Y1Q_0019276 [Alligator mississippiensis]